MIAIVHSIYSQSVHAPALNAGLMDNEAERYCIVFKLFFLSTILLVYIANSVYSLCCSFLSFLLMNKCFPYNKDTLVFLFLSWKTG